MFHYFGRCETQSGDALPGWFVECVRLADMSTVVPIYADENATPILSLSGTANRAKVDSPGNYDFFVSEGIYGLKFYDPLGVYQGSQRYVVMGLNKAYAASIGYINVLDYMVGGASASIDQTAELARLQQAVTDASTLGLTLLIPPTNTVLRVNGSVTVPAGGISITGGGEIFSTADAPLFIFADAFRKDIGDFRARFELTALATAACAIQLAAASGTAFFQYNRVHNIHCYGAVATVVSSAATRTTSYGEESSVNWNHFEDLRNYDWTAPALARNVVWFTTGSGTGNTYEGSKGLLGAVASAYHRFDGSGCVVGDVIIYGGHFCASSGGSTDCAVFEYGPNTVYRDNISVTASQADAQLTRVFRLSSTGAVIPGNIVHDGSLVGGSTVLGIDVPLQSMKIDDRDMGEWTGGQSWATNSTGLQTIAVCKVTLGAYTSVRTKLVIDGLVSGVSAGNALVDISLKSDGSTATATTVSTSADPSSLFGVSYSISGLAVTIQITFTPSTTGSNGSVTWAAVGNRFFLQRLP